MWTDDQIKVVLKAIETGEYDIEGENPNILILAKGWRESGEISEDQFKSITQAWLDRHRSLNYFQ